MSTVQIENSDPRTFSIFGVRVESLAPVTALSAKPSMGPAHIDIPIAIPAGAESVSNICLTGYVDLSFRPSCPDGSVLTSPDGEQTAPHPGLLCHDSAGNTRCFVPGGKTAGTLINQGLSLHVLQPDGSEGDAMARFSSRVPQSLKLATVPGHVFTGKSGQLMVRLKIAGDLPSLILFKVTAQAHFPAPKPVPAPAPVKDAKSKRSGAKGGR